MAKYQTTKHAYESGFYTAFSGQTTTKADLYTLADLTKITSEGWYNCLLDISNLDIVGTETYTLTVQTDTGSTTLGKRLILPDADLTKVTDTASTDKYQGKVSIPIYITDDLLTDNLYIGVEIAAGTGSPSISGIAALSGLI